MEASVVSEFELMKVEMGSITVNTGALSLPDYIEKWRVSLWKKHFNNNEGNSSFTKSNQLTNFFGVDFIIKRVLYMFNIFIHLECYYVLCNA